MDVIHRLAVVPRDVAALEAAVEDEVVAILALALVPPPVPRLTSGSRPSKSRGTTDRIECASKSSAKPNFARIRSSSRAR